MNYYKIKREKSKAKNKHRTTNQVAERLRLCLSSFVSLGVCRSRPLGRAVLFLIKNLNLSKERESGKTALFLNFPPP